MRRQYFAQYLLNTGVLDIETVRQLLLKASKKKAQLPVLAMHQKNLTAAQIEPLQQLSAAKFTAAALEQGLLSKTQVRALQEKAAEWDLRFAQAMIDKQSVSYAQLADLFARYEKVVLSPLQEAVVQAAGEGIEKELGDYSEYVELFSYAFTRFMGVIPVVELEKPAMPTPDTKRLHMVSQRMSGDLGFVAGMIAYDDIFLELSRHYSGEDFSELSELAIDGMEEFLNVVNGLFAVELAKREVDIDLELPHTVRNSIPIGNLQLVLRMDCAYGAFGLILSSDEFLS